MSMPRPIPNPAVEAATPYAVPRAQYPVDLYLDGNEGAPPPIQVVDALSIATPQSLRRYPSAAVLERALARRNGIDAAQVFVTAGADEALDRVCRAMLAPGRNLVVAVPTFAMLTHYATLAGAEIRRVPWADGAFPVDAVIAATDAATAVIAVVTPNNPTGAVARAADLAQLSSAAPHALLVVDLAYGEYADVDLTEVALALENALVVKTFSKAYGLASLRVGYAIGAAAHVGWLRVAGSPYPVAGPSVAAALTRLEANGDISHHVASVRREREALVALLRTLGARPQPSQANFVYVTVRDAIAVRDELARRGIAVRAFPGRTDTPEGLRITCPGDNGAFARLQRALVETFTATGKA